MDATALETFLSQFGISQHQKDQGKICWSITVTVDAAKPQNCTACFDERLKTWRLHTLPDGESSHARSTPGPTEEKKLNEDVSKAEAQQNFKDTKKYLMKELTQSERRASRMAEIVPVGIYELSVDGSLRWANSQFFDLMGVPHGQRDNDSFSWRDHILPEDYDHANEEIARCLMQGVDISGTLQLRRSWNSPGTDLDIRATPEPFWVMYSASPFLNADGSISSLIGSVTDISHLKWAEQLQLRIAEAAQKERRLQEEFIDITSHEMRNPLSAITQSAEGVLLSL